MSDVITKQTNNDGTECVVIDNGNGHCTIIVGRPIPLFTVKTNKDRLAKTLRQIKEGKYKEKKK